MKCDQTISEQENNVEHKYIGEFIDSNAFLSEIDKTDWYFHMDRHDINDPNGLYYLTYEFLTHQKTRNSDYFSLNAACALTFVLYRFLKIHNMEGYEFNY